jgi:hypothetical protein
MMLGPKAYGFPVGGWLKATHHKQIAATSNENEHWFWYKLPPPESMRAGTRACFCYSFLNLIVMQITMHASRILSRRSTQWNAEHLVVLRKRHANA